MENKGQIKGVLSALTANLIFGFSFIFSKMALNVAQPLLILAVRFTVAFLALNLLIVLGVFKPRFKGKKIGGLMLMSIAQPLTYFIFELYGLKLTSSALSGIIIALVPVGVALFSGFILGEKPTVWQIICSIVSLVGVTAVSIVSNNGSKSHILGILLLVGAVISATAFNLLSRNCSKDFSPFERTYFMFLVGSVGFNLIAAVILKKDYIKGIATAFQNTEFIIAIIYLAVISSVAAFMLYNYSTTKITAICSSSFSNIITVISVLAGVLILNEDFSPLQLILCLPIIAGVWGVNFYTSDNNRGVKNGK